MRAGTIANAAVTLIAALMLCAMPQATSAADAPAGGYAEIGYSLTFTPTMPEPGREVVVTLVSGNGVPDVGQVRWNLSGSGASFANAGVKGRDGLRYAFTPQGPGTYTIQAEFRDPSGTHTTTSLMLVIGERIVTQHTIPGGAPAPGGLPQGAPPQTMTPRQTVPQPALPGSGGMQTAIPGISLVVNPPHPKAGQPVTFTFDYGEPFPRGSQVRWDLSGGAASGLSITGTNKEALTFVPSGQGRFVVKAELYCALGNLLGSATHGFTAMP